MFDEEPPVPEEVLTSAKDQLDEEEISLADNEEILHAHEAIETYDTSYYETQWSERSRACFHRSGGTDPTFAESSPVRGTPF